MSLAARFKTATSLLVAAVLLAACWGGPDITPLEVVTVEPAAGSPFGTVEPSSCSFPRINTVSQSGLSIFFSQNENDPNIPAGVLDADPELMAVQQPMVVALVDGLRAGHPPLTPEAFHQQALARTNDPGTASILCHNVLKAMARG